MKFHVNMNFKDIAARYGMVMLVGIVGGVLQSIPIMALAIPLFLTAILGWCPIYQALGIDHNPDEAGEKQIQAY
jgi:hypothetical protein